MDPGSSCSLSRYDGEKEDRIPYSGDGNCHDCNVRNGAYHHPGCDMERCPVCGGQAIICDCNYGDGDSISVIGPTLSPDESTVI